MPPDPVHLALQGRARHSSGQRVPELDSLRGIAALWVVVFHFTFGLGAFLGNDSERAAKLAIFTVNIEGLLAVDLFFMISGFVIFMTLERCASLREFAISRFSRLFPAYWACFLLTLCAIVWLPLPTQTVTFAQAVTGVTMFNAFLGYNPIEAVYWSLAVELAFYILMACVHAFGWLHRIELLGGIWLALSALLFSAFPELGALLPWRVKTASVLPYAPLFFAGILLFRVRTTGWTGTRAVLLATCLLVRLTSAEGLGYSYILGTLAIFAVVIFTTLGWAPRLGWPPLVSLGGISYPLYLIHQSIGFRFQDLVATRMGFGAWPAFCAATIAVILLAGVVSILIERPARTWIRRRARPFIARESTAI